jgi:hypothetical protein
MHKAIVGIHINKTAGTSLPRMIEENYRPEEVAFIYPDNPGPGLVSLESFKRQPSYLKRQLLMVMGHVRFGIHEDIPKPCRYFTFLRDPVERVLSTFYHHKNHPGSELHELIIRQGMGLGEFLDGDYPETDNWMNHLLCGEQVEMCHLTEANYQAAICNLEQWFDFVLLTERFSEGVCWLAGRYGWQFREVLALNRSEDRLTAAEHPPEIIRKIHERNNWICGYMDMW